jgi:hypothetical protein
VSADTEAVELSSPVGNAPEKRQYRDNITCQDSAAVLKEQFRRRKVAFARPTIPKRSKKNQKDKKNEVYPLNKSRSIVVALKR